jgi:hypothetical protein
MRLIFHSSEGDIDLDVNPKSKIGDLIKTLKALEMFFNKDIEILYKLKQQEPETSLEDLGVKDGGTFLVRLKTVKSEANPNKKKRKMPSRSDVKEISKESDPPTFERDVESLMEMGFPREDCERALRFAFYNLDRASMYLVTKTIPQKLSPENVDKGPTSTVDPLESITPEELGEIHKLADELNIERLEAVQCFCACDKDLVKTRKCINGW